MKNPPLAIAIMGPTASGKTAAAFEIARVLPVEIISVDSALIYKEMDVGTAKPTKAERKTVPHHLIDLIDPSESYSVSRFTEAAIQLVLDIAKRGKLPLLVGGTMMYFNGLFSGLDNLPPADPNIRKKLDEAAAVSGWAAMHDKLAKLDPVTAARLKPSDAQRIQRALEIIEITGKPLSALHTTKGKKADLPFSVLSIALEPSDRSRLHERIANRFDEMMRDDRLIDEVIALRKRGDLHLGLPSMRCVGYRQTWQYLDGEFDKKTLREKGIAATRQLAKRQLTWLRSMPDKHIIDCLDPDMPKQILSLIQNAD